MSYDLMADIGHHTTLSASTATTTTSTTTWMKRTRAAYTTPTKAVSSAKPPPRMSHAAESPTCACNEGASQFDPQRESRICLVKGVADTPFLGGLNANTPLSHAHVAECARRAGTGSPLRRMTAHHMLQRAGLRLGGPQARPGPAGPNAAPPRCYHRWAALAWPGPGLGLWWDLTASRPLAAPNPQGLDKTT